MKVNEMNEWEYEILEFNIGKVNLDIFNSLGREGYELVNVIERSYDSIAFFKKRIVFNQDLEN